MNRPLCVALLTALLALVRPTGAGADCWRDPVAGPARPVEVLISRSLQPEAIIRWITPFFRRLEACGLAPAIRGTASFSELQALADAGDSGILLTSPTQALHFLDAPGWTVAGWSRIDMTIHVLARRGTAPEQVAVVGANPRARESVYGIKVRQFGTEHGMAEPPRIRTYEYRSTMLKGLLRGEVDAVLIGGILVDSLPRSLTDQLEVLTTYKACPYWPVFVRHPLEDELGPLVAGALSEGMPGTFWLTSDDSDARWLGAASPTGAEIAACIRYRDRGDYVVEPTAASAAAVDHHDLEAPPGSDE
jgi:hypothetical protein